MNNNTPATMIEPQIKKVEVEVEVEVEKTQIQITQHEINALETEMRDLKKRYTSRKEFCQDLKNEIKDLKREEKTHRGRNLMKQILKYALKMQVGVGSVQEVEMPGSSDILDCQYQHGEITIWASVFPNNTTVKRKFLILGTGDLHAETFEMEYVKTLQELGGLYVWHIFEIF
tara:strand:+ start:2430 stop:2948 length:519 start_codon:yes stop_codon:yes gene_type:complete